MNLLYHVEEEVPSPVDDVAAIVELVVLEVGPMDVTSTVLAGVPVVDAADDMDVVEVLVSLLVAVTICDRTDRRDRFIRASDQTLFS